MATVLANGKKINGRIIKEGIIDKINYFKNYKKTQRIFLDDLKMFAYVILQKDIPMKYINKKRMSDLQHFPSAVWAERKFVNPETKRQVKGFFLSTKDIDNISIFWEKKYKKLPSLFEEHINSILKQKKIPETTYQYDIIKSTFISIVSFFTEKITHLERLFLFSIKC